MIYTIKIRIPELAYDPRIKTKVYILITEAAIMYSKQWLNTKFAAGSSDTFEKWYVLTWIELFELHHQKEGISSHDIISNGVE